MNIKHLKRIGRKGALARMRLYGNPGTTAGRRLGGLHSILIHRSKNTGFIILRKISFPHNSSILAELCGILAGDGHIGEYQITVTTNTDTDIEHAQYVKLLFEKLFNVPVSILKRRNKNACVVVVSSKEVSRFFISKGLVKGHKIHGGLKMPLWISSTQRYKLAFMKGLFDTDGCVYIDMHKINGRKYKNIGMAFTNRSLPLLNDFKKALESIGLHPTQKTKYTVFLRRKEDIRGYFDVVGSSNQKHVRKIATFFSQSRRCARNW